MTIATDPRLPADRPLPTPGGMLGLEGTNYAGYRIIANLDGTYVAEHQTAPGAPFDAATWELVGSHLPSLSAAIDAIEAQQNEQGMAAAE